MRDESRNKKGNISKFYKSNKIKTNLFPMVFCRIMHNHIKFLWLQVEYLLHRAWERGGVFAPFLPSSPSTLIKACPLLWHASSYMSKESPFLLDLFSICESHSATLRQQEMNQRPVCICIGDIGLGTTV